MKLFLSPHNDDETLFGAFTLLRERPWVVIVTDSFVQANRGDTVTAAQRREETLAAMKVLGLESRVLFMGVRDDKITLTETIDSLTVLRGEGDDRGLDRITEVYAPAIQHGHVHHDIVGQAALNVFGDLRVWQYSTYSARERFFVNFGKLEVVGTPEEHALKQRAMRCYKSQYPRSWRHFAAVENKSEWLTRA